MENTAIKEIKDFLRIVFKGKTIIENQEDITDKNPCYIYIQIDEIKTSHNVKDNNSVIYYLKGTLSTSMTTPCGTGRGYFLKSWNNFIYSNNITKNFTLYSTETMAGDTINIEFNYFSTPIVECLGQGEITDIDINTEVIYD